MDAKDNDVVPVTDPEAVKEAKLGGIDQETLAFLIQTRDLFSYLGGNLDALGGLSAQSETLGQDQLLTASASERIISMQKDTIKFTKEIVTDIARYLYYEPMIDMPLTKPIPGYESLSIATRFNSDMAEADFLEYNFDIQPFSMQHQTPESKLRTISQILTTLILPMQGSLQQQGVFMNFESLFDIYAKYGNIPELRDILIYSNPLEPQNQPIGNPPEKSNFSHRVYERVNRPGATRAGKDDAMVRLLMGSGIQNSEANALRQTTM
jgi:hypothetical protein